MFKHSKFLANEALIEYLLYIIYDFILIELIVVTLQKFRFFTFPFHFSVIFLIHLVLGSCRYLPRIFRVEKGRFILKIL